MENQTGLDYPDNLGIFYHVLGYFARFQREDEPCLGFAQKSKSLDSTIDFYYAPLPFLTRKTDIQCLAFRQQAPSDLYVLLRSS